MQQGCNNGAAATGLQPEGCSRKAATGGLLQEGCSSSARADGQGRGARGSSLTELPSCKGEGGNKEGGGLLGCAYLASPGRMQARFDLGLARLNLLRRCR